MWLMFVMGLKVLSKELSVVTKHKLPEIQRPRYLVSFSLRLWVAVYSKQIIFFIV